MKKLIYILFLSIFTVGLANAHQPVGNTFDAIEVDIDPAKEKVTVTPNPATTFTQIKSTSQDNKIVEISIFSLLGNKLFTKAYSGDEQTIQLNVQNFKKGKYLIKVGFSDGTVEVKALIKQ